MSDELAFLVHQEGDTVAVAVRDVEPGEADVAILGSDARSRAKVAEPIPLGHKIALVELAEGAQVVEYGEPIGLASQGIKAGELVHVHNIRSTKWQLN